MAWCGVEGTTEVGRYLGSARNGGVWGTSDDFEVVCNEALLSRGRGPAIHSMILINSINQANELPHVVGEYFVFN